MYICILSLSWNGNPKQNLFGLYLSLNVSLPLLWASILSSPLTLYSLLVLFLQRRAPESPFFFFSHCRFYFLGDSCLWLGISLRSDRAIEEFSLFYSFDPLISIRNYLGEYSLIMLTIPLSANFKSEQKAWNWKKNSKIKNDLIRGVLQSSRAWVKVGLYRVKPGNSWGKTFPKAQI